MLDIINRITSTGRQHLKLFPEGNAHLAEILGHIGFTVCIDVNFALESWGLHQPCFKTVAWMPMELGKTVIASGCPLTSAYCLTSLSIKIDFHEFFLTDNFLNLE